MARTLLKRCEFGVSAETEEGVEDCGEPAVASWDWGDGPIVVCERHDEVIARQEEEWEVVDESLGIAEAINVPGKRLE
jgi:hypothetical protein